MDQNTIEYQTIQNCSAHIQATVQGDLINLSGRLFQCGLITDEQSAGLTNQMQPEAYRAKQLVSFVLTKVSSKKENYGVFINEVLGASHAFYRDIIKHIGEKYREIQQSMMCDNNGDLEVQPKPKPEQEERIQSDFPSYEVANGRDDGPKPKYGKEELEEIMELKAPSRKLKEGDEHYEGVQKFAQDVELLIQTVNDNETWAVLAYMEGPRFSKDQQLPKVVNFGKSKVRLGMISHHKAALVQTGMGANCEKKLFDALNDLPNVKGIIALGIAWGHNGKLADVLVATQIVGWNEEKWVGGKLIARDRFYVHISEKFRGVFADLPGQWRNFERAEKIKSSAQKALIISTAKLINDETMRNQVIAQEPEAKGGEMEGHVLVQKLQKEKPWLHIAVIKGISDFADGNKHDEWQLTAAMAAVDYAKYMLDETDSDELFD